MGGGKDIRDAMHHKEGEHGGGSAWGPLGCTHLPGGHLEGEPVAFGDAPWHAYPGGDVQLVQAEAPVREYVPTGQGLPDRDRDAGKQK